jgi:hypothetical protein
MKKIMTEAVAVANATARAMLWDERNKDEFLYEGSYWKKGYPGGNYQFLKNEGMGGRNMDATDQFYYFATVNTPAMAMKLVGAGSQYAWGYLDADGNYLDGSKTYKLNIPKMLPPRNSGRCVSMTPRPAPCSRRTRPSRASKASATS